MIEQINNTLEILRGITEKLDEIGVNTEVIERNNRLIYDKLDTIETISRKRNQTIEQKALNQWEIERNNECYMTLSYVITRELQTLDDTIKNIYSDIGKIQNILKSNEEIKINEW